MKKREEMLRVQCHECGRVFDFADYLTTDDNNKVIAELVLEKCRGDLILCKNCRNLSREMVERGTFEWVAKGPGGLRVADLELLSEDGKKAIFKVKSIGDEKIIFEAKRSDFKFD